MNFCPKEFEIFSKIHPQEFEIFSKIHPKEFEIFSKIHEKMVVGGPYQKLRPGTQKQDPVFTKGDGKITLQKCVEAQFSPNENLKILFVVL